MIIPRSEQRSYPPFSPSLFSLFLSVLSFLCVTSPIGFAGLLHSVFACRVPSVYLGLCLPFLIWLDRLHPGAYVCSPLIVLRVLFALLVVCVCLVSCCPVLFVWSSRGFDPPCWLVFSFLFFRPTPSWLSPGRSTCSIPCCNMGLID